MLAKRYYDFEISLEREGDKPWATVEEINDETVDVKRRKLPVIVNGSQS